MGEEEGGEGGRGKEDQGGFVKHAVRRLEGDSTNLKLPRCVKPSGRRGVKRDGLVQTRIESLVARGGGQINWANYQCRQEKVASRFGQPWRQNAEIIFRKTSFVNCSWAIYCKSLNNLFRHLITTVE